MLQTLFADFTPEFFLFLTKKTSTENSKLQR